MKKALITITLVLAALSVASAACVLFYFATKKVKVQEKPAYVYNIQSIDDHAKYVVTTTTQWKDVKVDNELVFDSGIRAAMERYNESAPDSEDAYIKKEGDLFVVVPEVEGKDLDIERSIKEQKQIRIEPAIRQGALTELCERANLFATWSVTYDNGDVVRASIDNVNIEGDEIRLDDISNAVSYSTGECCRAFKTGTGKTIFGYIKEYRVKRSMNLLVNTDLSVSDIAYSTGFSNTSYFIKCFKEISGTTPLKYRSEEE